MAELEHLDLNGTRVGDDGIARLLGHQRLKRLQLWSTRVTDEGFLRLRVLPDLNYVVVADRNETDEQLANARRYVRFGPLPRRTPVTDAAIQQLQRALPKLEIRH